MFRIVLKYGLVSVVSYAIVILGTALLVEVFGIKPQISYMIALTTAYIYTYFANTFFVFKVELRKNSAIKFLLYLLVFWFLNNIFFNAIIAYTNIPYQFAIVINIVVLGVIRFFVQKKIVFNKTEK